VTIIGVGLDVVQPERVARLLGCHGARFERLVYTERELADCAGRADRVAALAGRVAAKEAFLKALGTGWASGLSLRQVEVVRANGGPPELALSGAAAEVARRRGVTRAHLSLSHEPGFAAAVVILEG
jgi:holo-[acyl-carrier protein] synthase